MAHVEVPHRERMTLAEHGMALPDGSYPTGRMHGNKAVDSPELLEHAFEAYGREHETRRPVLRRYLVRRAVAMGRTDLVPSDWRIVESGGDSQ